MMNISTIEQTLKTLASVDEAAGIELDLDASIYGFDAVRCALDTPDNHCTVSVSPGTPTLIRLTPKDPRARRLSVGLALTKMLQIAIAAKNDE